jgi:hypothetical protein
MPLANINGNEINYKVTGGDKPAIIFSHGGCNETLFCS